MANQETFKISARIPSDQYRVAEVLLRKPENAHIQTLSDFIRRGFELAIVEASRNVPDPEWAGVADLVIKQRSLEAARVIKEWKLKLEQEQLLAKLNSPTNHR